MMPMDTDGAEQVRRTIESLQVQLNDLTLDKERLERGLKREMDRADNLQKIVARHGLDCEFRKKLDEIVLQNGDIKAENERLQIELVKTQDKWADEVDSLNHLLSEVLAQHDQGHSPCNCPEIRKPTGKRVDEHQRKCECGEVGRHACPFWNELR